MDLRTQFPRSLTEQLGPYVHLPRMIDKCRGKMEDMLGDYRYPCPLDTFLLDFLEIDPEDFFQAIQGRTDHEILEWVLKNGKSRSESEIHQWNQMMLTRGPDTPEKWEYFLKIRDAIDSTREDIVTWVDLLDLEEGRTVSFRCEFGIYNKGHFS